MNDEREAAIRRLLPAVRMMARRISRLVPGADLDDLVGDGCVGIIRAVDGFDPAMGPTLDHYARRIALGAMLNGIRRLDPVSERVRRALRIADRDRFALAVENGALPAQREMDARHPGLARARAEAYRGSPLSLDAPLPPEAGRLPHGSGDPADAVVQRIEQQRIRRAVEALPQRQRDVVVAHYYGERPLRALSEDMRISPQRVSQLHLAAIARIRRDVTPA